MERVRGSVGEGVSLEARRHLDDLHHRGGGVRSDLYRCRAPARQAWTFLDIAHRRNSGEPGLFSMRLHQQPELPVHLLRCDRRVGQRLRLCDADSGHVQVVPRQAWSCRRTGGGRLWRRFSHLRSPVRQLPDPSLWLADHLSGPGRDLPGHDRDRRVSAEESSCWIQARGLDAGSELQSRGQHV